jgi:hypothetical protein
MRLWCISPRLRKWTQTSTGCTNYRLKLYIGFPKMGWTKFKAVLVEDNLNME